jgi:AAA15 family ATPase/GTPase
MILQKLEYQESDELANHWELKDLTLGKINLLVGKNATGKTNTITRIAWLGDLLAGIQPQLLKPADYYAEFADAKDTYKYWLEISRQNIVFEKLVINGEEKFVRNDNGTGEIYADELNCKIKFQLPPNQLVVVSKRDIMQHPYLEELYAWADGLRLYEFGSSLGKDNFLSAPDKDDIIANPREANSTIVSFVKGEHEFSDKFKESVMKSMERIGYELNEIGIATGSVSFPTDSFATRTNTFVLYVREEDSDAFILQSKISQGMFRALSIIIQITYIVLNELSTTILIDDIGEGLDFERSSKLIKLLIEIAEKNENIQLVMSTNDRFVMNNVPLKYWQVIQRKGGECKVFNYQNSKEKFDEFKYMGLNNFDFLATDYINSEWEEA